MTICTNASNIIVFSGMQFPHITHGDCVNNTVEFRCMFLEADYSFWEINGTDECFKPGIKCHYTHSTDSMTGCIFISIDFNLTAINMSYRNIILTCEVMNGSQTHGKSNRE